MHAHIDKSAYEELHEREIHIYVGARDGIPVAGYLSRSMSVPLK